MGIFKWFKKQKQKFMSKANNCVKVGDIVKVTANSNTNNYCIGKEYVITDIDYDKRYVRAKDPDTCRLHNCLAMSDFVIVSAVNSRERITKELDELKAEMAELQSRLDWMDELGTDDYNPTEHKVWSVMNAVENQSLSKRERVKLIASLIDNK